MPKILMEESENDLELEYEKEFHYQKFRYETEKRTGKKQHLKPMMSIKVKGLPDIIQKLCVYIFCVSSNDPYCVHPNKLVGKDCHNGVYHTTDVKMKKNDDGDGLIEIPYLYICRTKKNAVKNSLDKMFDNLPHSAKEKEKMNICKPNDDNVKTDSIRLKVMLEINGREYNTLTSIITHHDSGEKVKLNIVELSSDTFTSEDAKSYIRIFTEDSIGPDIKAGDFEVQIRTDNWKSEPYILQNSDILYKRVFKYEVPECKDSCIQSGDVKGKIVLRCRINDLTCEQDIVYIQSKLNRKRKTLNERSYHNIKRLRLDSRGQSPTEKSQDIGMRSIVPMDIAESFNSNRETATSDSTYTFLQNNSGKTFVPVSEPSTFVPAPQKTAPQIPVLDNVRWTVVSQQSTSDFNIQASAADSLSNNLGNTQAQAMDLDNSDLYLSNNTYSANKSSPIPQRSQATGDILTQNDGSYEEFQQYISNDTYTAGKSLPVPQGSQATVNLLTQDSSYKEFNQVGSSSSQADPNNESTPYQPCLSNNTYPAGKSLPVPQGSEATDMVHVLTELDLASGTSQASSFGKSGYDSGYVEHPEDPSITSTSYQPQVEPITPLDSRDIISKSAQWSGIPTNSAQDNVEGQSSQKEVQIQPVSNDMRKGFLSGSSLPSMDLSVNLDSFNMDSVDLMQYSGGIIKYADCDFQGGPSKPDQLKK